MRKVIALDPGTSATAWAILRFDGLPLLFGKDPNDEVLRRVSEWVVSTDCEVICEQIESYGMPVGREVFEAVRWCGRFEQEFRRVNAAGWCYLPRRSVKLELCMSARANDASIRQALIDIFGGKDRAIGKKASPGPLYGVSGDVWAAVAVGITHIRQRSISKLIDERSKCGDQHANDGTRSNATAP